MRRRDDRDPMSRKPIPPSLSTVLTGRCFVHPLLDYLLIGGGLSLLVTAIVVMNPMRPELLGIGTMAWIVLFSNGAHFAASTVRLYTKPGAAGSMPFLSKAVPPIAIILMTLCVVYVGRAGSILDTLYLTWSPYHYAAQAYGLAVMYSYRSGCNLEPADKKLLRWVCMIPLFYMAGHILGSRLPVPIGDLFPALAGLLPSLRKTLVALGVAAPFLLFIKVWRARSGPMPLISLLTVLSNAVWFFVLDPLSAFLWATVFHGLQYLAIVIIFDVKDRMALPGNAHGRLFHTLWFYGMCLGLGCVLFVLLPRAYSAMGFDYFDSRLVSVAVINIHHFIVDAYIWRLGKGDTNRKIVEGVYCRRAKKRRARGRSASARKKRTTTREAGQPRAGIRRESEVAAGASISFP